MNVFTKSILAVATVCILIAQISYSQNPSWQWAKRAGGSAPFQETLGSASDANGNVFFVGAYQTNGITLGSTTLTNSGGLDMFVVKYDANGNVVWAKGFGGSSNDVASSVSVDPSGNVFVGGQFNSPTLSFGSTTLTNSGGYDGFVIKLDPSGNALWAKQLSGNLYDRCSGVSADAAGNVYVTGDFVSTVMTVSGSLLYNTSTGFSDFFLVKYDGAGNKQFANKIGGALDDYAEGIATDDSNFVYVTGRFQSTTINFGTSSLTNSGFMDFFVAKFTSTGFQTWANSGIGTNAEYGVAVATDPNHSVYVTGKFVSSTLTLGTTVLNNNGTEDVFMAKYGSGGVLQWAKSAGGANSDFGYSISTDNASNVYFSGGFNSSSITFGSITVNAPTPIVDPLFIAKLDSNGNALCAGMLASGAAIKCNVSKGLNGYAYIGANYQISPFWVGAVNLTKPMTIAANLFFAKFNCSGATGIDDMSINGNEMSPYPNPFSDVLSVSLNPSTLDNHVELFDVLGNRIYSETVKRNLTQLKINTSKIARGIYFLKANGKTTKVVKTN